MTVVCCLLHVVVTIVALLLNVATLDTCYRVTVFCAIVIVAVVACKFYDCDYCVLWLLLLFTIPISTV